MENNKKYLSIHDSEAYTIFTLSTNPNDKIDDTDYNEEVSADFDFCDFVSQILGK